MFVCLCVTVILIDEYNIIHIFIYSTRDESDLSEKKRKRVFRFFDSDRVARFSLFALRHDSELGGSWVPNEPRDEI